MDSTSPRQQRATASENEAASAKEPLCRCPPNYCYLHPRQKTCGMRERNSPKDAVNIGQTTVQLSQSFSINERADAVNAIAGALDLIDMYDQRLVQLGDPEHLVYSAVHVAQKARLRSMVTALSAGLPSVGEFGCASAIPTDSERKTKESNSATLPETPHEKR